MTILLLVRLWLAPITVEPAPGVDVYVFDSGDVVVWAENL